MEFSVGSYLNFLNECKKKFSFSSYSDFKDQNDYLLLRHDIDFSVKKALEMARAENAVGVKATYLFDIHSPFYNPLEEVEIERILDIKSLGHDIGIHFDHNPYKIKCEDDLVRHLGFQVRLFNHYFGIEPSVFSFHNPDLVTSRFDEVSYCGLVNTYSNFFKNSVPYCSDSGGVWRHQNIIDFIHDSKLRSAQILVHPIWWQGEQLEPALKVRSNLDDRLFGSLYYYVRRLRDSGRPVNRVLIQGLLNGGVDSDFLNKLLVEGESK